MKVSLPNDFEPRPYQARFMDYLDRGGKRAVWVVHRRAGKDLTALHQAAKMAFERVGLYWHMLPSYSQARKVIWNGFRSDGKRFIDNAFPKQIVKARNETEMRLELVNGSIIQLVGSDNYDSLVGSNPIGVTYSEFALNKPSAWDYVRPMLTENGGWAAFITTPRGLNHAWKMWQVAQTEPGWFAELQTIYDTKALPPSVLEEERKAGMPDSMIRQEYLCDWQAALVGSVWGDLMEELGKRGGLVQFDAARDEVFTSWDLGVRDSTGIWFFRLRDQGIEFIDHFEAHGKPLSFYADEIEGRGYKYVKHWLPHDANARHLGTEVTVLEQLQHRFGRDKVAIGPRMSLLDGIQAGRWLLQQPDTRFHPKCCEKGLEALRAYHYEWDEDSRCYSSKPEHDWSSHSADSYRYAAVVARVSGIYKPRAAPKVSVPNLNLAPQFTLDDLWKIHGSRPRPRRIR